MKALCYGDELLRLEIGKHDLLSSGDLRHTKGMRVMLPCRFGAD